MSIEQRESVDGSLTLFNTQYQESYHNLADGAKTETLLKHIMPPIWCQNLLERDKICILDMCFGLGYNTFWTIWKYLSLNYQGKIEIFSPEKDKALVEALLCFPYPQELMVLDGVPIQEILKSLQSKGEFEHRQWRVEVFWGDACQYVHFFQKQSFDIIYQDAFSPAKNPELWSAEYFQQISSLLKDDGVITTYSQKASVRDILKQLNLYVYEIKHQGIRNSRIISKTPLDYEFLHQK
ncbi:hypothetical protein BBW65_04345 [Helicobacter enhydrae]|uniref:MnmC-like methyltransferase domain-containing protein n=1 Tax=Helicobacter enhydrae TaxID=222136 RepID=A0A1B1U5V5_9HELI|nr:MnmC family methyltransferase [Helicobacter enhydrae]ANV98075.1 hypothetical protein BBW65_04345 [Helicobacter enhydrae]